MKRRIIPASNRAAALRISRSRSSIARNSSRTIRRNSPRSLAENGPPCCNPDRARDLQEHATVKRYEKLPVVFAAHSQDARHQRRGEIDVLWQQPERTIDPVGYEARDGLVEDRGRLA